MLFSHESPLPVLPPPRKDLAAIGCTEIGRPIGVTVHLHCVESFENPLQRYGGEGRVAMDNEKTHFFLNTLYKHKDGGLTDKGFCREASFHAKKKYLHRIS